MFSFYNICPHVQILCIQRAGYCYVNDQLHFCTLLQTLMNAKPTMVAVNACNASTTWDHLNVAAGMDSDREMTITAVHKFSQHPMLESAPTIGPRHTQPM